MSGQGTRNSPLVLRPGIAEAPIYVPGAHGDEKDGVPPAVLSANENPLGPSPQALDAYRGSAALERYPDGGAEKLRAAIGEKFGLDPARIVCGAGSDELITLLIRCYVGPGDEVLQSQHGFLMYAITAKTVGASAVLAPETPDLLCDVDAMLAAVTDRTRICFVANPNNPTGTYIPASELRRLREGLRADILLAVDAAYSEYVDADDYSDGADLVRDYDNVVMLRTFSKAFGLAALRVGWCYAPAAVVDALNRVRSPFNVSVPAQVAGVAALGDAAHLDRSLRENKEQRARLVGALSQLGLSITPSVTNFLLVHFADATSASAANAHLSAKGVIVRSVAAYGLPASLRMTVGTAEENDRLLSALTDFLA
ncbi:histidinol-phosphate transaminase [Rhodospirillaceae bacterium KN72]|uniref:Histidinol-phosphate aminotransferase n=1 Tax=Pacificispira spongiicola TaxID=2729598 RepID=A0A7Y0DXR1_9PROT|nr:histidinol-phosphate transaminase [Pacificispira spongiicola]NMM43542.1 histidinol-phosphate transaminase [Pacificispira spongiicola]